MRILFNTISFCEYVIGQANGLAGLGHKVLIMMPDKLIDSTIGENINDFLEDGVTCLSYDVADRKKLKFYKKIWNKISAFNPDIIHFHENGELETLSILIRFFNTPFILTVHDITYHPGQDSDLYMRRKIIRKLLRQFSSTIHVHGHSLQKQLQEIKKGWYHKSVVIPHGSLKIFLHWRKTAIDRESRTCLFFGRMEKYKGLDNLLKIGDILKAKSPGIKIIIAGTGSELDKYKALIHDSDIYELHDNFIPNQDIYKYFDRASILLLPYQEASQSGIALMGLIFGLPVVAMAVGSIPDLVLHGKHGLLVDAGDVESFAEAVTILLDDIDRLEGYKKSCLKLADDLSFDKIALKFEKIYKKLIEKDKK